MGLFFSIRRPLYKKVFVLGRDKDALESQYLLDAGSVYYTLSRQVRRSVFKNCTGVNGRYIISNNADYKDERKKTADEVWTSKK